MTFSRFILTLMILTALLAAPEMQAADYTIRLVSGDLSPAADPASLAAVSRTVQGDAPVHCIVQLTTDPDALQKDRLNAAGITLLEPVSGYAWLATVTKPIDASKTAGLNVRWAGALTAEMKQHPRVKQADFGPWAKYTDDKVIVTVRYFADVPAAQGRSIAEYYGAEAGGHIETLNADVVAMAPEMIGALAREDAVEFIDALPPPLTGVNDVARQVTGANTLQAAPYNLTGAGVTVCVYDAGLVDAGHNDFAGRITLGEAGSTVDHSTHVAGSVGGSGANSAGQYRGMAPGVQIVSYAYEACSPYCLYNSPQDIEANYRASRDSYGTDICTNSIGSNTAANGYSCSWEGDYELVSQLLDNIVRGSLGSPFIVLYAAGNERGYGTCGTTYSTMGVPGGAKNVITVGATDDADAMSDFSSWGPTDDGRVKPEVCAPGVNIYSTMPGNTYGNMSGTSMATPVTAGCTALMLQQFGLSYPGLIPMPSTIKALLINTALDLGNAGPDYIYGFGRINAQSAVDQIVNAGFLEAQLSTGQTNTHTFTVPAGRTSLRVSLSWMDPAASPLANPTLVNDLDVTLTSPTSTVYYPFVLNPSSPSGAATTGLNHRDNSEQIVLSAPAAGTWTITVSATTLPSGPQSYSLACSEGILAGYAHVTGTVTDAGTMAALPGAVVRNLSGIQADTTDATGSYDLFLPAGAVTLEFSHFGYATATESITVPSSGSLTVSKALNALPSAALTGYVYNPASNPVAGAQISVVGAAVTPATTNASGFYTLTLPVGAQYVLRATAAGYAADQDTLMFSGATSHNFNLGVLSTEDFESANFTRFPWAMGGTLPWTITTTSPHAGTYCARSGAITHNQTSDLSVNLDVAVAGTVSFYYKVSSEATYDFLQFYLDGVQQGAWSGKVAWTLASYSVTAGNHTFLWRYMKDGSLSSGSDAGFVDDITFPTLVPPPEFTLSLGGVSPVSGTPGTPFTFSVTYTSANNIAPQTTEVFVDGLPITMSTADVNYTDGSVYTCSASLLAGVHHYYFRFVSPEPDGAHAEHGRHCPADGLRLCGVLRF